MMTLTIDSTWIIESITDTRARDCQWKSIPGTGDAIPCECCGRTIEVHASVYHPETGERLTIGTQCCKRARIRIRCGGQLIEATNKQFWKMPARRGQ